MTHRAGLIVDQVAALINARLQSKGCHVYTDRRESLDPDQDEMPAISVDYGDDAFNFEGEDYIDSTLSVLVTALVRLPTSEEVREKLLELRTEIHKAVCADRTLGLDFVIDVVIEGASATAPEISARGGGIAGGQMHTWPIKYRMNFEDPAATGSVPNL